MVLYMNYWDDQLEYSILIYHLVQIAHQVMQMSILKRLFEITLILVV